MDRVAQRIVLPAVCSNATLPDPEIIGLLALGRAINQVAAELSVKVRTVRTDGVNITRKLNFRTWVELFEFTISSRIINIHPTAIIPMACSVPPGRLGFEEDLAKVNDKTNE